MSLLRDLETVRRNLESRADLPPSKVAVIAGASKGLGKAMALALGAAGASIALASRDVIS
jgi:NADP-dependent 3-hydroxy acid dehydrogenase YdfG